MTPFPSLEKATFKKRYKRFFADIETSKGPLTIHVPNTGSMKGCLEEGADCLYTPTDDPKRKLKGTLQFLKTKESWVGVNTSLPNQLVKDFWESGQKETWKKFSFAKLEHKINAQTRLDMVMAPTESDFKERKILHFVEVKNVTMAENGVALFPDAVTTRGQKHLEELMGLASQGFGAEIFFVVQRTDCMSFSPCEEIDPTYAKLLKEAQDSGVNLSAYPCWIDEKKGVGIANSPLKILI
ncbi:DNA/RNA nuclease SfsA [bacterium]|nr:DNA/RNA nuclease SfsA [bacterium]